VKQQAVKSGISNKTINTDNFSLLINARPKPMFLQYEIPTKIGYV